MELTKNYKYLLTAIVPIGKDTVNWSRLESWLVNFNQSGLQAILVYDSEFPSNPWLEMKRRFESENIEFFIHNSQAPGLTRNIGLNEASGKWVCFWDADDSPVIENFFKMVELADSQNYDIALGSFAWTNERNRIKSLHILSKNHFNALVQVAKNPGIWRFAFNRSKMILTPFTNLKMAEDQIFLLQNRWQNSNYMLSQEIVYEYFSGGNHHQTSKRKFMKDLSEASKMTQEIVRKDTNTLSFTFGTILFLRQNFTTMKKCPMAYKIRALISIMGQFLSPRNFTNRYFWYATMKIF